MVKFIDEKRKILIIKWFNNVLLGNINVDILLIDKASVEIVYLINTHLRQSEISKAKYIITDHNKFNNDIRRNKDANIILTLPLDGNLINFKPNLDKSFLVVPSLNTFYLNIDDYINYNNINNNFEEQVLEDERYLYYIEKSDPFLFIKNRKQSKTSYSLISMIENNLLFWNQDEKDELLCNKINFKINNIKSGVPADLIMLDINEILTSRLAVLIYRITTLNLRATTTEVGRFFNKKLGSKSKTFNYSLIQKSRTITSEMKDSEVDGKNFKAYDLTINEFEMNIRKEIALKLNALNLDGLDAKTIATITQYPKAK